MADVIRVSLFGTMPGGEKWSVNPVWSLTTGAVILPSEALAIVAAVNAVPIPTQLKAMMSTETVLTGCRVEARTAAGVLEVQAEGLRSTPLPGSASGNKPFQTSLVLSLRSTDSSARGRGRMYWPATAAVIDPSTLRISAAGLLALVNDTKTYLTALTTAVDSSVDETVALCVWSRTGAKTANVGRIQVGDILDTQRRRRDALPESYQAVSFP